MPEIIHPVDKHVGRRVCEKRLALGYNQSDLGRALGLTFQQIQKYEKGANRVSASKLWDISQFFKVEISYFFEGLSGEEISQLMNEPKPTRYSVELGRVIPTLPIEKQRLVLDLARQLSPAELQS